MTRLSIPSKEVQLHIVGARESFKASRIQRMSLNTDVPSTTVDELGNSLHVGDVKDIPNVTLTFSAMDVGIKIFSALTGTDPDAYPGAGVDISSLGEMDAIVYIKNATSSDYVKSAHARRLQVRDFTFNYSIDGESTEDYTAVGSEKRWFTNDVYVDKFTSGTTSFNLTETPIQLRNDNYALSVILDGKYKDEVTGAPSAGEYRIVGTTLTTGDTRTAQVMVVYQAAPAGDNWSDVSDSLLPVAIRGMDVPIQIAANSIPRVQSVTVNGTLNSEVVKEMGNRQVVGYQTQVPEVTGTITVLDTDTQLLSLLEFGVTSSGTEYAPGEGCESTDITLTIELYDPCTDDNDVLKTVFLDAITVVGDSYTSNVNQSAQQTFNWKSTTASCKVYSGAI